MRFSAAVFFMGLGAFFLFVTLVGVGLYRQGQAFITRAQELFQQPQPTPVVDMRTIVVRQVRGASELTTAIFSMEAVVAQSRDRTLGPFVIGQTKLLYVAYGEVRAGVDLGRITADDVQVISDTVIVRLPPPEILDSKIDVERSYVYDFEKGLLGPDDPEMQSRAERVALEKITQTACETGLLDEANRRAETAVRALLTVAGFREVRVVVQPPSPGTCRP
ncbi:MAG: DUF4230 domain-containing protein [Ardenticatenia bacterium]|nr:DUF4230 domain-containing protein [Ardenticatenia bacterium]